MRSFALGIVLASFAVSCADEGLPAAEPLPPPLEPMEVEQAALTLAPGQGALLDAWYAQAGERRPKESFGDLVSRVAQHQLGKPYAVSVQGVSPAPPGARPAISLEQFRCVTLVEHSIALARCIWKEQRDEACFVQEVQASRYRDGVPGAYGARLHYFADWLQNNADRQRLAPLTERLGGRPQPYTFNYITQHPDRYPALAQPGVPEEIAAIEARLSARPVTVLSRQRVAAAQSQLRDGDVVALVGNKPGLLVTHTGLVRRDASGTPRLLHASSRLKRVVLGRSVADYVLSRSSNRGIMVMRPLAPQTPSAASAGEQPITVARASAP